MRIMPPILDAHALTKRFKTTEALAGLDLVAERRTALHNVRNPQVFLLIFRYVFGGAITTNGVRHVDFLIPGFVGTGVLFAGIRRRSVPPRTSTRGSSTGCAPTPCPGWASVIILNRFD